MVITEQLPANTTLNSTYSDSRWDTEGGGLFTLSVGDLPVGTSGTVTFAVTVASPLPGGVTQIANTASIADAGDSGPDLNPANNTSTNTTPIINNPQADLQITKTDNQTSVQPGSVITYTITITNAGPNAVTGATFTDDVPPALTGVTYTNMVSGGANVTPGSGSGNNIGDSLDIPVGGTVIYTVTGTLDPNATDTLINLATVLSPADTLDPNTGNNTAIDSDPIVPVSDLSLNKTFTFTDLDGSGTLTPGDRIVFALTVTNSGPNPAQGVSVADQLPNGYQFISDDAAVNGDTYSAGTGLWTIAKAISATAPNNTAVLHITAIVGAGGTYANVAEVQTSGSFDPDSTPGNRVPTEDDYAAVTPTVQPKSDLSLAKTMALTTDVNGDGVISVGDRVTFTLTLNNVGPNDAANVHVKDLLPAGYTFFSATTSQGTYTSATGDWNLGTVTVLSSPTLRIVATVAGGKPASAYTNYAQVSASGGFDPDSTPDNNSITVANTGPDPATYVTVQDTLPAEVLFVSATPVGSYNDTTGVWTVGTVAPGTPQTLLITARAISPSPGANTASVSHSDQFDPDTGNDTATVTPQRADLAVTKSVSNATPDAGDIVTFTITLANAGPDPATGVTVADPLPAGLRFVSATASRGSYDGTSGVWAVGTVTVGTPQTLQIRAEVVSAAPQTNVATIGHAAQFDPDPGNDAASATVTPPVADLALVKTVDQAQPVVGSPVTFTCVITNHGPDPATGVVLSDPLPPGVAFVSASASQGTYDPATGLWAIGTLPYGGTATLRVVGRVAAAGPLMNAASVSESGTDPDLSNNRATATLSVQPGPADISKRVLLGSALSDPGELPRSYRPRGRPRIQTAWR